MSRTYKHTGLPCTICRKNPRLISSTGKELTQCQECQRASWSRAKHKKALADRPCRQCGRTLPLEQFPKNGAHRKTICKACYSQQVTAAKSKSASIRERIAPIPAPVLPTPQPVAAQPTALVFLDPATHRVLFCDVVSEKIIGDRNLPHIINTYLAGGYRVVVATEQSQEQFQKGQA
jgi:hypothetical protein